MSIVFRNRVINIKNNLNPDYGLAGVRQLEEAVVSPMFQNWLKTLETQSHLTLTGLEMQSIDMFGPRPGFLKFVAKVEDDRIPGKFVPGITFMRGDSVAILFVVNETDVILTVQNRIPQASEAEIEIPAGMLDGSNNFAGVAAQEIEEELGETIKASDLNDLGIMKPSQGGCDEKVHLFSYNCTMTPEKLAEVKTRNTGILEEGESITLKVVKLKDLVHETDDAKALCAAFRYTENWRSFPSTC
jgi:8-oxo-dGTP pyrophosphatase MutT (NUDIX family)